MAIAIILATALRGTRRGRHSAISCCSCGNLRPRTLPCALAPPSGAAVSSSSSRLSCLSCPSVCLVGLVCPVCRRCGCFSWALAVVDGRRQGSTRHCGFTRALGAASRRPRRGITGSRRARHASPLPPAQLLGAAFQVVRWVWAQGCSQAPSLAAGFCFRPLLLRWTAREDFRSP